MIILLVQLLDPSASRKMENLQNHEIFYKNNVLVKSSNYNFLINIPLYRPSRDVRRSGWQEALAGGQLPLPAGGEGINWLKT